MREKERKNTLRGGGTVNKPNNAGRGYGSKDASGGNRVSKERSWDKNDRSKDGNRIENSNYKNSDANRGKNDSGYRNADVRDGKMDSGYRRSTDNNSKNKDNKYKSLDVSHGRKESGNRRGEDSRSRNIDNSYNNTESVRGKMDRDYRSAENNNRNIDNSYNKDSNRGKIDRDYRSTNNDSRNKVNIIKSSDVSRGKIDGGYRNPDNNSKNKDNKYKSADTNRGKIDGGYRNSDNNSRNRDSKYKSADVSHGKIDGGYRNSDNNSRNRDDKYKSLDASHGRKDNGYRSEDNNSKKTDSSYRKSDTNQRNTHKDACPHRRECGGCNILRDSYENELKEKKKYVEKLISSYCKVEPIIGMEEPKYYRNKVHVVYDHDRKGNPISGVYEEGTHRVIPIDSCLIHNQKADAIIASIRGMLKSFKIKTYDEDSGYGLLRHVLIRTGFASGEIMVVLVLASPILPSKNNFVKALLKLHPEITTIVINVNDRKTSMVLGEKEHVIYGKGYIEDKLCQKVFRISPSSFYQVNPAQTEVLYGKAIEMAKLTGKESIIDAYCGIGTIGIIASDHVKRVIGVEINKEAVKDANMNAKRNSASNIEFYQNDAGEFMSQMAAAKENVDVVFMDPPRSGSSEKFMDSIALLKPKKVVYISCNPVTLDRDLKYLSMKGYKAQRAVPVDMFPWTEHVEVIIMMTNCGLNKK